MRLRFLWILVVLFAIGAVTSSRPLPDPVATLSSARTDSAVSSSQRPPDPGCELVPESSRTKVLEVPPAGYPKREVSGLALCTAPTGHTVVINTSPYAWVVTPVTRVLGTQFGGLPLEVTAFRKVASRVPPRPGHWLEPGSALEFPTGPMSLNVRIDPTLQQQWMAFKILQAGAAQARDNLPNLILTNEKYRAAASTCLDAGARAFTAATDGPHTSQTLIDKVGLGAKSTQCTTDLNTANVERRRMTPGSIDAIGPRLPDLPSNVFAKEAGNLAGRVDDGLTFAKSVFQAVR